MELAGCAVLVSGAASGIGAAIVADLVAAGARVAGADRDDSQIVVDLSRPGGARRMVAEAVEQLSGLDVLINNAGGYSSPTYPTNEDWRSPLELNLLSVMEAIESALPSLVVRPGCVVNVASSAALGHEPYAGVEYAVAKAGMIRLTTALGQLDGVRVNCICPHTVATDSVLRSLETRTLEEVAPSPSTLLRLDEVVAGVRRLIEDDSLSGRVLLLSGGEPPRFLHTTR
ncbi:MAG TPA: SDR family oxidoreductase [Gaiellaceae bacterium]|nr:SDR family oxidoreductase [Gaiellaceae bacterium]